MAHPHPCLSCGACCASFRVDFSIYESEDNGGRVPRGLVDEVNDFTCRMRGTDYARPRCAALTGTVGERAACGIYEQRSRPCRDFPFASYGCHDTREKFGLSALSEEEVQPWLEAA